MVIELKHVGAVINVNFNILLKQLYCVSVGKYRGADMSLARQGRKQATATEVFDLHISYLQSKLEE